jgi:hypothetical protein
MMAKGNNFADRLSQVRSRAGTARKQELDGHVDACVVHHQRVKPLIANYYASTFLQALGPETPLCLPLQTAATNDTIITNNNNSCTNPGSPQPAKNCCHHARTEQSQHLCPLHDQQRLCTSSCPCFRAEAPPTPTAESHSPKGPTPVSPGLTTGQVHHHQHSSITSNPAGALCMHPGSPLYCQKLFRSCSHRAFTP